MDVRGEQRSRAAVIVKKFYADTAGEALRLVRKALGAEALILGNRRTAGGVEIMAVAPSEFESVTGGVAPARTQRKYACQPSRCDAQTNAALACDTATSFEC